MEKLIQNGNEIVLNDIFDKDLTKSKMNLQMMVPRKMSAAHGSEETVIRQISKLQSFVLDSSSQEKYG